MRAAWEAGVVLAGVSAGAICWFEGGTTDSFGPDLRPFTDGLGLLAGSYCPHYDSEPGRRPLFTSLVAAGRLPAGIACDDGAGAHFIDDELHAVVSGLPGAAGYLVRPDSGGGFTETGLAASPLPGAG
jgi:peptidase E